jgi:hypothetical protein
LARIERLNWLDGLLYDASVAAFEAALAAARGAPGSLERGAWDADAAEFARMQAALKRSFEAPGAACAALKAWYTLSDVQYEARGACDDAKHALLTRRLQGLIGANGHAAVPPAAEVHAMMAAYHRSSGDAFC